MSDNPFEEPLDNNTGQVTTQISDDDIRKALKILNSSTFFTFSSPSNYRFYFDWGIPEPKDKNRPKDISDEDYANFKKIEDPKPEKLKRKHYESQIHTDSAKENPYWVKFSRTNNTLLHGRHRHPKR